MTLRVDKKRERGEVPVNPGVADMSFDAADLTRCNASMTRKKRKKQLGLVTNEVTIQEICTKKEVRNAVDVGISPGEILGGNQRESGGEMLSYVGSCPMQTSEGHLMKKKRSTYVVQVFRTEDLARGREKLPIIMMEQEIMEAIMENSVIIVCGETGSGKTTQVPQFLYEAGYGSNLCKERSGMIGVTQPRRVAVLATARRVAQELNVNLGQEVGFQVRHDCSIGPNCCIKFMTDGILLREVQADFLLRKYSLIIIDEAHERSLNTDILIGMLSRIIPLRQSLFGKKCNAAEELSQKGDMTMQPYAVTPLKLVIMSATLRVEDFTANRRMFPLAPPVVQVPARQFPVTVHFSKKTELLDYAGAAYKKVCAIHRQLPPGGILVFLTGQKEVEYLCKKLRKTFPPKTKQEQGSVMVECGNNACKIERDAHMKNHLVSQAVEQVVVLDTGFGGLNMETISAAVDENGEAREYQHGLTGEEDGDLDEGAGLLDLSDNESEGEGEFVDGVLSDNEVNEAESSGSSKLKSIQFLSAEYGRFGFDRTTGGLEFVTPVVKEPTEDVGNSPQGVQAYLSSSMVSSEVENLLVLPLYAMLPASAQLQVFDTALKGTRLVVVATNVAETSLTIPGIRYVVDSGRAKVKEYDRSSGVSRFVVQWISKASADQRAGRAGRTGPGHCYRLYSSAHFNNSFPQFLLPEIRKAPIDSVVLLMKSMGIDKVVNFPFPTQPDQTAVVAAERCLTSLSAIMPVTGLLTAMGKAMAFYPISPRHSRMLLAALQRSQDSDFHSLGDADISLTLAYTIAVAAALSFQEPFLRHIDIDEATPEQMDYEAGCWETKGKDLTNAHSTTSSKTFDRLEGEPNLANEDKANRKSARLAARVAHEKFHNVQSDALSIVNALWAFEKSTDKEDFCRGHFLHVKTMEEMSKLRKQLVDLVIHQSAKAFGTLTSERRGSKVCPVWDVNWVLKSQQYWQAPTQKILSMKQENLIRRAVCAGWADRVSRRLSSVESAKAVENAGPQKRRTLYQVCSSDEAVSIHPSSHVSRERPNFVVYNELLHTTRIYMRGITAVDSHWLVSEASSLCSFSKPLEDPPPFYKSSLDEVMCWVIPSFGPHLWELPLHSVPLKKSKLRTAVFACSLLQGKVLPCFRSLCPYLTNDPKILLKPESLALKRVSDLLHRIGSQVITKKMLAEAWLRDSTFLYPEILSWLQSSHKAKLDSIWERARHEANMQGEELFFDGKP